MAGSRDNLGKFSQISKVVLMQDDVHALQITMCRHLQHITCRHFQDGISILLTHGPYANNGSYKSEHILFIINMYFYD